MLAYTVFDKLNVILVECGQDFVFVEVSLSVILCRSLAFTVFFSVL